MAYNLNMDLHEPFGILEVVETTADTRTRLSNKATKELVYYLIGVDKSIKAGFENAIYFQEWSVGSDILRKRGYKILGPSDLYNIGVNIMNIEECEAQDSEEYDCDKCHMCEPGDRYCIRD